MRDTIRNIIRKMATTQDEGWSCPRCGTWIADGGSCPNPQCK